MSATLATVASLTFTLAFLVGLRARAAYALLNARIGKDLSWSVALFTSFGAITVFCKIAMVSPWPSVYAAVAFEALAFYAIGKATCAAAGCCGSQRQLPANLSLPIWELIATETILVTAACALWYGATSAIAVMTIGHLATRAASRFLRTGTERALLAPDIGALTIASVALFVLR